jgi:hypothetical protein
MTATVAAANEEAMDKRVMEEAMVVKATEEAVEKVAAIKEAADKRTADEATVQGRPQELPRGRRIQAAPPRWQTTLLGHLETSVFIYYYYYLCFILSISLFCTAPLLLTRSL